MIKRTFEPGFRIALHQKDLNLALSSARKLGVLRCPTPPPARSFSMPARRHGGAAWDHSGMVRALEKLSNHEIGAKVE